MSIKIKNYTKEHYTQKQSKYKEAMQVPYRLMLIAPSGSGKTILIQNLIIDIYDKVFERVYIFSPSIFVDSAYNSIKDYQKNIMKVEENENKLYFDHYEHEDLEKIISQQHDLILHMKSKKMKSLFNILIVIDDFADDPSFSRQSKLLWSIFCRGRHNSISVIISTQKFRAIANIIRLNCSAIIVFKIKNSNDLDAIIEELSGALSNDKKTFLEIYNLAIKEPYSFLYVNLAAKNLNDMFMINFDKKIHIED